jgi:predicted DnaQ family exonuclease/DinG family helicase
VNAPRDGDDDVLASGFVAVDVETTGLDPAHDEIIEVAAVKVLPGQLGLPGQPEADGVPFRTLVQPRLPIPLAITRLTGITEQDVANAPPWEAVAPDLEAFVGRLPLVAHNASFDVGFIGRTSAHLRQAIAYDTAELSRIALPRLRNHRLETLRAWLGEVGTVGHRALSDALSTAALFRALIEELGQLDEAVLALLVRLVGDESDPTAQLLRALASNGRPRSRVPSKGPVRSAEHLSVGGANVWEAEVPASVASDGKGESSVDPAEVRAIFDLEGSLARAMLAYEPRPQQVRMAEAVVEALNADQLLLVEAGTGTGKSFAYLVPAILWAFRNGRRVIISTQTKTLQDQLFTKDIPAIGEVLGVPFRAVLLKGRANYVCTAKWRLIAERPESALTPRERRAALPLVTWLGQTRTGDLAENTAVRPRRAPGLIAKIASDGASCPSERCRAQGNCRLHRVRRLAQEAHLVIVNHALLFADLASGGGVLGDYDELIVDEAHHLERTAAQHLGRRLAPWIIADAIGSVYRRDQGETGATVLVRQALERADDPTVLEASRGIVAQLTRLEGLAMSVSPGIYGLFENRMEPLRALARERGDPQAARVRIRPDDRVFDDEDARNALADAVERLRALVDEVDQVAHELSGLPVGGLRNTDDLISGLNGAREACAECASDIEFLAAADDPKYVYWAELPQDGDVRRMSLNASPIDIAERIRTLLLDRLRAGVFTSATLAVGGRFDYMAGRLGLDLDDPDRIRALATGTPFDYASQVRAAVLTGLPSPKSRHHTAEAARALERLVLETRRGALALFTSHSALGEAYAHLKPALEAQGICVLGQGIDGSRGSLFAQFKADRESVLLGTDSFWEGIDVPGEALEVLAIMRLPFAVPSDPLVEAQLERLAEMGEDPFRAYSVPEAVIRLRQGCGRLIRTRRDRGAVVLLDPRVMKTWYGRAFLEALPTETFAAPSAEALAAELSAWFGQEEGDTPI